MTPSLSQHQWQVLSQDTVRLVNVPNYYEPGTFEKSYALAGNSVIASGPCRGERLPRGRRYQKRAPGGPLPPPPRPTSSPGQWLHFPSETVTGDG